MFLGTFNIINFLCKLLFNLWKDSGGEKKKGWIHFTDTISHMLQEWLL